jgi:hypothetical protein
VRDLGRLLAGRWRSGDDETVVLAGEFLRERPGVRAELGASDDAARVLGAFAERGFR